MSAHRPADDRRLSPCETLSATRPHSAATREGVVMRPRLARCTAVAAILAAAALTVPTTRAQEPQLGGARDTSSAATATGRSPDTDDADRRVGPIIVETRGRGASTGARPQS